MNLKPKEMELDPYILGVYESVMKPYWPSPKTTFYCRICNYKEFQTKSDHDEHYESEDHKVFISIFKKVTLLLPSKHLVKG